MFINKIAFSLFFVLAIIGNLEANPHIDKGNAFAKNGQYQEALTHLNSAIKTDPKNARAYKLRGHVYYALGDYANALKDLDHVVALVPNSANALVDRAIMHCVAGKHGQALVDIDYALTLRPNSAFAKAVREEILERAK